MSKLNCGLCGVILLTGVLHVGYLLFARASVSEGIYFSNGTFIMSDGGATPMSNRIQFKSDGVYDYMQISSWYYDFFRRIDTASQRGYKLVTISAGYPQSISAPIYSDEDVVFNKAYYSKLGAPLTLYRLMGGQGELCFYIRELSKLRCFSHERARQHPPF